jgi:hypothetical protein
MEQAITKSHTFIFSDYFPGKTSSMERIGGYFASPAAFEGRMIVALP